MVSRCTVENPIVSTHQGPPDQRARSEPVTLPQRALAPIDAKTLKKNLHHSAARLFSDQNDQSVRLIKEGIVHLAYGSPNACELGLLGRMRNFCAKIVAFMGGNAELDSLIQRMQLDPKINELMRDNAQLDDLQQTTQLQVKQASAMLVKLLVFYTHHATGSGKKALNVQHLRTMLEQGTTFSLKGYSKQPNVMERAQNDLLSLGKAKAMLHMILSNTDHDVALNELLGDIKKHVSLAIVSYLDTLTQNIHRYSPGLTRNKAFDSETDVSRFSVGGETLARTAASSAGLQASGGRLPVHDQAIMNIKNEHELYFASPLIVLADHRSNREMSNDAIQEGSEHEASEMGSASSNLAPDAPHPSPSSPVVSAEPPLDMGPVHTKPKPSLYERVVAFIRHLKGFKFGVGRVHAERTEQAAQPAMRLFSCAPEKPRSAQKRRLDASNKLTRSAVKAADALLQANPHLDRSLNMPADLPFYPFVAQLFPQSELTNPLRVDTTDAVAAAHDQRKQIVLLRNIFALTLFKYAESTARSGISSTQGDSRQVVLAMSHEQRMQYLGGLVFEKLSNEQKKAISSAATVLVALDGRVAQ